MSRYSNRLEVQNPGYSLKSLENLGETGRINNADYRDLNRVDTLTASQRLAHRRDLGLIKQVSRGAATYYVPGSQLEGLSNGTGDDLFSALSQESGGLSQESEGLSQESREQLLAELPETLRVELARLGQRSRDPQQIPRLIQALCALRPYGARDLALLLKRRQDYLLRQHIGPLLDEQVLRFREERLLADMNHRFAETLALSMGYFFSFSAILSGSASSFPNWSTPANSS